MTNARFRSLLLAILALASAACAYNPAIERQQLILVTDAQLVSMADSSWSAIAAQTDPSGDAAATARTRKVSERLLLALGEPIDAWTLTVFEDEELNAFALPGRKIGINTGMIAFCRNDDELAAVIGHEIAHVTLHHAAERVSQDLAARGLIELIIPDDQSTAALLGAGATLGIILPYSRKHELEADRLGLRYVFEAGYDPMLAVDLWTRMSEQSGRSQSPEWLSTHPADAERIARIRIEASKLSRT